MSDNDDRKRKRDLNFSQNEKQLLISIISKYAHIIENKKTDKIAMETKNKAWNDIETEFNMSNAEGVFRSGDRLKKFFNNKKHDMRIFEAEETKMKYLQPKPTEKDSIRSNSNLIKQFYDEEKKKVKFEDNAEKKYIIQTGMGRLPVRKKDGTEELMLSIMNRKTIYGLDPHPFDSDNQINTINNNENINIEYIFQSETENFTDEAHFSDAHNQEETTSALGETTLISKDPTWKPGGGFTAEQLTTPITSLLSNGETEKKAQSCERRGKSGGRRRPTDSVKILTSSTFAEKYNTLLDKRLIHTTKQIEHLEEERAFKRKQYKLKLELLQLQIDALKK